MTWLTTAIVFFLAFRIYPLLQALYMSLHQWAMLRPRKPFVGVANYTDALTDPLFLKSVSNTIYYAFAVTVGGIIVAMGFAVCMNAIKRFSHLFRTIYFMPVVTSTIAISTVWLWLYQPKFGLFNQMLKTLGLPGIGWVHSVNWAMPALLLMAIWQGVGFTLIILLAGLKDIPSTFYEAAAIDGASGFQLFRYITLPILTPVLTFLFVTGIIQGFRVFEQVYLMTRGGPLDATRVISYHLYVEAFEKLEMGSASAMAFILLFIVLVFTLIQMKVGRTRWNM